MCHHDENDNSKQSKTFTRASHSQLSSEKAEKKSLSLDLLCVLLWQNTGACHGASAVTFCTTSSVPSSWSRLCRCSFICLCLAEKPKDPGSFSLTVCLAQFLPWSILSTLRLNCIHLISRCALTSCLDLVFEPSLKVNPRVVAFDMFCNIQTHWPFYLFHLPACMFCIWTAKAHRLYL